MTKTASRKTIERDFKTHSDILDSELEMASLEISDHRTKLAEDFALRALARQGRVSLPGLDEALEHAADIADGFYAMHNESLGRCSAMYGATVNQYKGFRPLSDQVLVRPLPAQDRVSSSSLIVIPGNHDRGRLDNKLGVVLALGPGDPIAGKCDRCVDGTIRDLNPDRPAGYEYSYKCVFCEGGFTGKVERTPFEVQVGDTVLYAARGWAEIELDNEKLVLLHDCQHLLAVVDPDTVLFTEDSTTKKKGPGWTK